MIARVCSDPLHSGSCTTVQSRTDSQVSQYVIDYYDFAVCTDFIYGKA